MVIYKQHAYIHKINNGGGGGDTHLGYGILGGKKSGIWDMRAKKSGMWDMGTPVSSPPIINFQPF